MVRVAVVGDLTEKNSQEPVEGYLQMLQKIGKTMDCLAGDGHKPEEKISRPGLRSVT